MRLHDYSDSGNGYKVRLLLSQLGIPFEVVEWDILQGQTRTPAFLAKNPNGRIPVLEPEEGVFLPESNAILWYLAEGTPFLPGQRWERGQVLRWLFFEQYSHEPYVATPRFWLRHLPPDDPRLAGLGARQEQGLAALGVMEGHLAQQEFFVAGRYTIADIALYAYTHLADQGGFDLAGFPNVRQWLRRVAAQPGYRPMFP